VLGNNRLRQSLYFLWFYFFNHRHQVSSQGVYFESPYFYKRPIISIILTLNVIKENK
jgi:hypothetical protein